MSVDYSKFLYLALLGKETGQKKLEFYTFLRFDSHAFKNPVGLMRQSVYYS